MTPTTEEFNVLGTKARAFRSIGLAILFIVSIAVWLIRQNDAVATVESSIAATVPRQEFVDTVRSLRSDLSANRVATDSAVAQITALIQAATRQQLTAVCQTAAQRDPQVIEIPVCRDARGRP